MGLKGWGQAEKGNREGRGHSFQVEDRNSQTLTGEHMTYSGGADDSFTLARAQRM